MFSRKQNQNKINLTSSLIERSPDKFRKSWGHILMILLLISFLLPQLLTVNSAHASWLGLSNYQYGANQSVVAETGQVSYITGCPAGGIDDFIYPYANVYIVPQGSTAMADVSNASGVPNTLFYIIIDEVLANTAPGGYLVSGDYAVIIDDCQDGVFQPGLDFYGEEFSVRIPSYVDPLQSAAFAASLSATKSAATNMQNNWAEAAQYYAGLFAVYNAITAISIATDPADFLLFACTNVNLNTGTVYCSLTDAWMGLMTLQYNILTYIANQAFYYKGIAADPPDFNYTALPVLQGGTASDISVTQPWFQTLLNSGELIRQEQALANALLQAMEKYQGAEQDGIGEYAYMQAKKVEEYARALAELAPRSAAAFQEAVNGVNASGIDYVSIMNDYRTTQERVNLSGLSALEYAKLVAAGWTEQDIADGLADYISRDFSGLQTASDLTNLALTMAADAAALQTALISFADDMAAEQASLAAQLRLPFPDANAGGPYTVNEGTSLALDATGSSHPDLANSSLTFAWDLDLDGVFDDTTGQTPSVVFNRESDSYIGLKVTAPNGFYDVNYARITVNNINSAPVITSVTPGGQVSILYTGSQEFTVAATDPDGDPLSYTWDIDGTVAGNGTSYTYSAVITDAGEHVVTVTVSDNSSLSPDTRYFWRLSVNGPDNDSDLYPGNLDCDDNNPNVNPGMTEVYYNGLDDDCNPATPDDPDADNDGYDYTLDCNDNNPDIYPGATETCNQSDDNCNGQVDEGVQLTFYQDLDGDTYGNPVATTAACAAPAGYVTDNTDCNDTNAAVNPGATEIFYNGIDDDCNPATADGIDVDSDGYADNVDCNDNDPTVNPGRKEIRHNGKDDDCNAATNDDYAATFMIGTDDSGYVYYAHSNGDGSWTNYTQMPALPGLIRGAAIFDADNDGDLDFLIPAAPGGNTLSMYLFVNDGSENFTNIGAVVSSGAGSGNAYGMTSGDFNEDGNMDFLISRDGPSIVLGLGDGKGGFTVSETNTGFGNGREMDVADFDHDGHLDFIRATYSGGEIRLFRGNGNGTFTNMGIVADPGTDPYGVTAADFNNDGHPDIIGNYGNNGDTYFYAGNGDGTFAAGIYVGSLDFNNYGTFDNYDFNRDGNQDIVSSSYTSRLFRYYPGNGDGTFGAAVSINPSTLSYTNTLGISAPPGPPPAGDPIAQIYPDYVEDVTGATIDFSGAFSSDDGSIVTYDWNFGDGSTASGANVTHTFPDAEENYIVRLTVTDNDGNKSISSAIVRLKGAMPVADAGGPYTFGENLAAGGIFTVTLDGSGSSDDSGIVRYQWDFGTYLEDAFNGTTLDTLKWTASTGVSQNGSASIADAGSWGTRYLFSQQNFMRDSELIFQARVLPENTSGNQYGMFGFKNTGTNYSYSQMPHAIYFNNGTIYIYEDGSSRGTFGSYTRNIEYEIKIVLKSTGAIYYLRKAGDPFWGFLYDSNYSSMSEMKVGADVNSGTFKVDDVKISLLKEGISPVKKLMQGVYSVTLTVTDTAGQQDTDTTTISIVPGAPPVSDPDGPYTFGESFANQGKWTASLDGSGSSDDVAIETYSWNFGDGTTGTGVTTSHQYSAEGTYTLTLTVTDKAGQSNTASTTVTIQAGEVPVSDPGGPYEVPETQVVNKHWTANFNSSGSSDDIGIWKYSWTFGDGGTSTAVNPSHEYAYPGTYTVTLTITDQANQTNTQTTTATVTGTGTPTADAGGPYFTEKGWLLTFNGSNSTDDVGILSYSWDFGDGTTGKGAKPTHTYSSEGAYTVTLTVKDIALQENTDTAQVVVSVGNPPAANAGGPYTTNVNLPIRLNSSNSADDYGILSYEWSVGSLITNLSDTFDGTTIDSAKWLYPAAGVTQNDAITLTGSTGWGTRYLFSQVNFTAAEGMTLYAQVNSTVNGYLMIGFKDTGTNYSYTAMPYALYFNFGSIYIYESGNNRGSFNTYSLNTVYDVKIVLKSITGGNITGATYYYKPASSPTWTLVYDSSYVPAYNTLKAGASYYSGTFVIDNLSLTSGISTLSGERPVVIYSTAGTYPVILKVTDGAGQSSTSSTTLTVSADPAVITVPWQFSGGIEIPHDTWSGEEVILKAVVKSGYEPLTYTWEFGDGTSTSGTVTDKYDVSARHIYTAASGTPFVAKLTVTDAEGRTGSDTFPIIVREKSLEVEINKAIDDALWFVHKSQNRSAGWWQSSGWTTGYYSSPTASSIHAMEINGHLEAGDFSSDPYVETVWRGMNYMLGTIRQASIGDQAYGDPDVNGNGIGIEVNSGSPIYEGGQVMMALVASGTPDMKATNGGSGINNRTYGEIVEDMAEMYYWGQGDADTGYAAGGWRYGWQAQADNSACQWAALGMDAAEEQAWINVPQWVKDRNVVWLAYSQGGGGVGYGYTGAGNGDATSPSGLAQVAFDNIPTTDDRWKKTENYLAQVWNSWYNGSGNYYALYSLAKSMRIARPNEVSIMGEGTANAIDWYNDPTRGVARTIVNQQDANGQFVGGSGTKWVEGSFRTAWGVIILSKTLFVLPPVADAGEDRVWGVDWQITFDGSLSYHLDPFRSIVLYEWDFDGDGVYDYSSTEPTATYTYTSLGTYTVTLRVKDDNDPAKYDTDTMKVIVAVPPHPPEAVPGGPYTGDVGIALQLDGSASYDIDPTDTITLYGWEIDGLFPYDFDDAVGAKPTVTFNTPGNYNIGLRVLDNGVLNDKNGNGLVDEDEKLENIRWTTINITVNSAPVADAEGPYTVDEGALITLDGKDSYDPDGNTLTFGWDLDGDGQFDDSPEIKPLYSWPDNGIITIGLQVSDGALSSTDTTEVTVLNVPPVVDAGPDKTVDEGQNVLFDGSFTDPGTEDTHTILWDFGDGTTAEETLMPSHVYADNGVYTVTMTVTDDDGGVGSDTLTVTVNNLPPVVNAGPDQMAATGETVNLAPAIFTDEGVLDTHTATIDWGDSTVEAGAVSEANGSGSVSGSHTYAGAGTYTVAVTVTDNDGASGSDSLQVTIEGGGDACPDDPNKTVPGICGCGVADTDSDNDGTADCNEECDLDPNKTVPGICGCGVADTDSDGDGTADCNDQCAADPNKVAPGICGCGLADTDSDNDGTADCNEECDLDPNKTVPGICGCGVADTDSDNDGTADCNEECDLDPNKTVPGICGCGVADTDSDGDGTVDCKINKGFVTGGGIIHSLAGAYVSHPLLTGRATIGFVSKYKDGAIVPIGQTEFQFKPGNLNFHSHSYYSLVISGAKATYSGTGTINGKGNYKFMISVIDADISKHDNFTVDLLRIKIWKEEENGNVVIIYDSALGNDSDEAMSKIYGGSVVIHHK